MFENEPDKDPTITDVDLTTEVLFHSTTCSFITAAGECVKVWDARNGLLIKSYDNIFGRAEDKTEHDEVRSREDIFIRYRRP